MKTIILSLGLFLFFVISGFKPLNSPGADAWHVDKVSVKQNVTFYLCNGDQVYFTEIRSHMDLRGVDNNNMSHVHGKFHNTGTGVSVLTGEIYTLDDYFTVNEHYPGLNKITNIKNKSIATLEGNMGSRDNFNIKSHFKISPKGEILQDEVTVEVECQ